jgi:SAM-dependent methyltransferase
MRLLRPLPPDRSFEQIRNHYLVERSIAKRLKGSSREKRTLIYTTMYQELFSKVPDHPRLTRRKSERLTKIKNKDKFNLVRRFLTGSDVFAEFGPGDSIFAAKVAGKVKYVYGIDITDQRNISDIFPENFELIIYDGYNLNEIESNSIDIIFSDQLIEHLHPEDTKLHFKLVHRLLKTGGKYVFRTPHSLTGPRDISRYFSEKPECLHMKEWTYNEIRKMLLDTNFSTFYFYWRAKGMNLRLPYSYFAVCEKILGLFPKRYIRKAAKRLLNAIYISAVK